MESVDWCTFGLYQEYFLMLNYLINYTFKLNISVAFYTKLLLYVHEGKVFFSFFVCNYEIKDPK